MLFSFKQAIGRDDRGYVRTSFLFQRISVAVHRLKFCCIIWFYYLRLVRVQSAPKQYVYLFL